jgi:hypothetical protein
MQEEKEVVSEEAESTDAKLVSVSESIKYRKRAQSAEKQLIELVEQLNQTKAENEKLCGKLGTIETEHKLTETLHIAGVKDIESAVLLARKRLDESQSKDVAEIVAQLKNEKGFLFDDSNGSSAGVLSSKTSGVRGKISSARAHIERQAKRAAQSQSKADMMEYLRARRVGK